LTVPTSSVVSDGRTARIAKWLGDGAYTFANVELGATYQDQVEVRSGLRLGDSVITNGQFLLDSESLIAAEVERSQLDAQSDSVWVMARIISATPDFGLVEVHHEPIPEWSWPNMTMSFEVLDPALWPQLKQGSSVHMRITATEFGYGIAEVMIHENSGADHQGHSIPKNSTDVTPTSTRQNHSKHNTSTDQHGDHHD
jgi:Cu(I)/Ag(I) efflux system membrane fusion protein